MDSFDDGDQFDNLWINCWEDDALDQYENDLDKNLNENLQFEKEQSNQKLFQSFQNSACAVAQMFKDKTQAISPWNSFQNAAGAITILYKDSLDACKLNHDLGVNIGQQRKVKELINWLRKKKRRTIRKDELISFLIGKQAPARNLNRNISSRNETIRQQLSRCNSNNVVDLAASTHSDLAHLATFREALIMHNRTRDSQQTPTFIFNSNNNTATASSSSTLISTNSLIPQPTTTTIQTATTTIPTNHNTINNHNANNNLHHAHHTNTNCDDLDCFFCEQIATHIEHKRSANNNNNLDLDSPTRKRSRFY